MNKLEIDYETADRITVTNLKDQLNYIKEELRAHIEEGQYLHPDDVMKNHQLVYCLEKLIPYFGS